MSDVIVDIFFSNAFQNAFWLFFGVVAGALIQHMLTYMQTRRQMKNALRVLKTEIELNLQEYEGLKNELERLKRLVAAQQVDERDLFINMQGFDYSAVTPLVQHGFFHFALGANRAKHYFEFMRLFNNQNVQVLTNMLRAEHQRGKSMELLDWIESKAQRVSINLSEIKNAKLKRNALISDKG